MSVHISSRVWTHTVGDPLAKLIYVRLADSANDAGECWPKRRTIARDCETSVRTVERKIEYLVEHGFVAKSARFRGGRRTSNLYILVKAKSELGDDGSSDGSNDGSSLPLSDAPMGDTESEASLVTQSPLNGTSGDTESPLNEIDPDLLKSIDDLKPSRSQRDRWVENPELTAAWIRKAMATPGIRNPAAFVDAQVKNGNEPEPTKPPRPSWEGSGNCTHQGCEGLDRCRFD
jgi:hypothetical protein